MSATLLLLAACGGGIEARWEGSASPTPLARTASPNPVPSQTHTTYTTPSPAETPQPWSATECAWAADTLTQDAQADQVAAAAGGYVPEETRRFYLQSAHTWTEIRNLVSQRCGYPITGTSVTIPDCRWAVEQFYVAQNGHYQALAKPGLSASDRQWHQAWYDAYGGLIRLFLRVCPQP